MSISEPGAGQLHRGLPARLERRLGEPGVSLYTFCGCLIVLAVAGILALLAHEPLIFPSLGPTAIVFFERPLRRPTAPRDAMIGHAIAVAVGYGALVAFGLTDARSAELTGVSASRLGAAALSVAITALLLGLLNARHAPAGATTLIVSLGILSTPGQLAAILGGVALLTLASVALNRLCGVPAPWWSLPDPSPSPRTSDQADEG